MSDKYEFRAVAVHTVPGNLINERGTLTVLSLDSHTWFRELEKLWEGWGIFEPQEFFSLTTSMNEFFLRP